MSGELSIHKGLVRSPQAASLDASIKAPTSSPKTIRVLAFVEASSLTGPAKNLIECARRAAHPQQSLRANIAIVTFQRGDSRTPPARNEFVLACQGAGLEVHIIRERFAFDPAVLLSMYKLIARQDPDFVQTHSVKSHFLVRLTGIHRRRHWIAFHHGYTWTNIRVRAYNQLDRWSLRSASRVVTVCRAFADTLQEIGVRAERIAIQHNSVNAFLPASEDRVLELRRTLGIPARAQVLLNVGRLSREKGQSDLIEAIALLRKEHGDRVLRVVFVGDGPDGQRLRGAAKRSGVADWVIFAGHQADVTPYYMLADLMVLPSHTEGSPNTLLEAMAAGLPIVATSVGGVPEIVTNNKEALLVEKHDPVALARSIDRLLGDLNLQSQISGRARSAAAAYSPAAYCDSMLELYNTCLAEHLSPVTTKQPLASRD
jgi:glycosyltransferase involved in cell wall biosynthesis